MDSFNSFTAEIISLALLIYGVFLLEFSTNNKTSELALIRFIASSFSESQNSPALSDETDSLSDSSSCSILGRIKDFFKHFFSSSASSLDLLRHSILAINFISY